MAIEYINREGTTYYLKSSKTKTGKTAYNFVKTHPGDKAVEKIPRGFEIAESITGLVTLRKKIPVLFKKSELTMVKKAIDKLKEADCEIEVKGGELTVHHYRRPPLPGFDPQIVEQAKRELPPEMFQQFFAKPKRPARIKSLGEKVFKIEIFDESTRTFNIYGNKSGLGSSDWILLKSGHLTDIIKDTLPLLDTEDFLYL